MGTWVCGYRFYDLIPIPTLTDRYNIFLFTNPWIIFCPIYVLLLGFYPTGTRVMGTHCHPSAYTSHDHHIPTLGNPIIACIATSLHAPWMDNRTKPLPVSPLITTRCFSPTIVPPYPLPYLGLSFLLWLTASLLDLSSIPTHSIVSCVASWVVCFLALYTTTQTQE
jgi:hypothetical protein